MKFKVGDRIVLTKKGHSREFWDQKGIVVSREEYIRYNPGSAIMNGLILHKLNNSVYGRRYYQTSASSLKLLSRGNYNE